MLGEDFGCDNIDLPLPMEQRAITGTELTVSARNGEVIT